MKIFEYFMGARSSRKSLSDTALRTADSGYLTRRLVDVSQDVIVREEKCGTQHGAIIRAITDGDATKPIEPLEDRLIGRYTMGDVINPETGEVLPAGEKGELVITCIKKEGIPLIRYRTKDITRLFYEKCKCGRTFCRMENLSGRSDDMLKIRGVNVFPSQIEEVILSVEELGPHYEIILEREGYLDKMTVKVELAQFTDSFATLERITKEVRNKLKIMLGLDAKVMLESPNTLQRFEGKAKRVKDLRSN
jgi:phenylacetate-CoA ligase